MMTPQGALSLRDTMTLCPQESCCLTGLQGNVFEESRHAGNDNDKPSYSAGCRNAINVDIIGMSMSLRLKQGQPQRV